MEQLREFLFVHVYTNPVVKGEESKAKEMLERLYVYFLLHPEQMAPEYLVNAGRDGVHRAVCDYIASMSDQYAVRCFSDLFIPKGWAKV